MDGWDVFLDATPPPSAAPSGGATRPRPAAGSQPPALGAPLCRDFQFTRLSDYTIDRYEKHVALCDSVDCVICFAAKRLGTSHWFWRETLLDPLAPDRGTWAAFATMSTGRPALGCWICSTSTKMNKPGLAQFTLDSPDALIQSNIKKHVSSQIHKELSSVVVGTIASGKTPVQITVLLMRIRGCDKNINVMSGIVGACDLTKPPFNGRATGIRDASLHVLREFCTPLRDPPFSKKHGKFDQKLFKSVCESVQMYTADSAAPEQVAGKFLKDLLPLLAAGCISRDALPNLKKVAQDKPHGVRRVCSRAWAADQYLSDTADIMILAKGSITTLIQNSPTFKGWFQQHNEKLDHCPFQANRIRDLSFAKHRFNSTQKPFGRHVLMFKSVIATATQIATSRVGKQESKLASAYLSFLDVERAVTLALLADAGDECNMLIRVMDTERMDVSAVSMNLRAFLSRIHALFVDEHCWKLGYTQYMVQQLQEPVLLLAMDGQKTLGCAAGVPVDVKRRCVQRMANWVHLARETIRAEIREFEIIYAMRAFNLGELSQSLGAPAQGSQHDLGNQTMSQLRASCDSLAEFVCVNPTALFSQLNDVRPIAQQMLIDPSCTGTIAAWAMAVAECQKDARNAKLHPVGALRPVLMTFGAYGPSTSGLEQNFSQILNLAGANRPDKWGGYIQDELVIKQPWSKDHIDRAVALAPKIWAKIYGPVRRPRVRVRMDLHKEAPARARDVNTETSWIRGRRADVQGVVSQTRPVDLMSAPGTRTVGVDGWTADHEKEVKFQQNKRQKRFHDS
ncbi:unnamed protein product, partial [Prorocentrum cordatum]